MDFYVIPDSQVPFEFVAPWGETMVAKPKDALSKRPTTKLTLIVSQLHRLPAPMRSSGLPNCLAHAQAFKTITGHRPPDRQDEAGADCNL